MLECRISSAETIWDVPARVLAQFFTLLADATEQGDPADFWPTTQLLANLDSIGARSLVPPWVSSKWCYGVSTAPMEEAGAFRRTIESPRLRSVTVTPYA
jgi:hypothetical protein